MTNQLPEANGPRIDTRVFRRTFGLFATGVTVVAASHHDHTHAMTANSVTSLSLDPPLIIFCVGKNTRMVGELKEAGGFTVSILAEDQQALSNYFAGRWQAPEPPPFRFVTWEGGPRLEGCVAAVGCTVEDWLEGGDHWIVLGRVQCLHQAEEPKRPLLFFGGEYRRLEPEAEPAPELDEDTPPVQIFYDPW